METLKVIDLLLKAIIAAAVYRLYHKPTLKNSSNQTQISERLGCWNIVSGLEAEILECHSQKWALRKTVFQDSREEKFEKLELRNVLNNTPEWRYIEDENASTGIGYKPPVCITYEGARYWQIRDFTNKKDQRIIEYVSSPAFHQSLIWFRKTERAIKRDLLLPCELADWWRQILPMGWSGRLEYLRKYFSGKEDIESIAQVISTVLIELNRKGHINALGHCCYFNGLDREILRHCGVKGKQAVEAIPDYRRS